MAEVAIPRNLFADILTAMVRPCESSSKGATGIRWMSACITISRETCRVTDYNELVECLPAAKPEEFAVGSVDCLFARIKPQSVSRKGSCETKT
jgi:hypothetical protein